MLILQKVMKMFVTDDVANVKSLLTLFIVLLLKKKHIFFFFKPLDIKKIHNFINGINKLFVYIIFYTIEYSAVFF